MKDEAKEKRSEEQRVQDPTDPDSALDDPLSSELELGGATLRQLMNEDAPRNYASSASETEEPGTYINNRNIADVVEDLSDGLPIDVSENVIGYNSSADEDVFAHELKVRKMVANKTLKFDEHQEDLAETLEFLQNEGEVATKADFPPEAMKRFALLEKFEEMPFEKKQELLSYFVDRLKADVLAHLATQPGALETMTEYDRESFYFSLDDLVSQFSNELFLLNQQKADQEQGKLVKESPTFKKTVKDLEAYMENFDLLQNQRQVLRLLEAEQQDLAKEGFQAFGGEVNTFDEYRTIQGLQPKLDSDEALGSDDYDPNMRYAHMPSDWQKSQHWQELDPLEANEILQQFFKDQSFVPKMQEEREDQMVTDMIDRLYLTERFDLDYAKFFHGYKGGYNIEKLKRIVQRIKSDQDDLLHPFLDPEAAEDLDDALEYAAMKRLYKRTGHDDFKVSSSDSEAE